MDNHDPELFMDESQTSEITQILHDWNDGNEDAKERLLPFVYDQLRRQAGFLMSRERSDHTLQPTALVHEAFIRLSEETGIEWKNRSHFYGIAANMMRQILIQYARRHAAEKRGSNQIHFSIHDAQIPINERAGSIIALDDALERLAAIDRMQASVVEMRFFGGFSNEEIAEALSVSVRTVVRVWQAAKFWLFRELNQK
jgi:RNA polymerase sigma factor (TIGR02999 family)